MKIAAGLVLLLLCLTACESSSSMQAEAGSGDWIQKVEFLKLFNTQEGLHDLVLVTRDFREEMALKERTTVLAPKADKYAFLDIVTFDRKAMGKDKVHHLMAGFWPVDIKGDPTNRVLLLVEATGEFLTLQVEEGEKTEGKAGPPAPPPGITSLEVTLRFVELQRNGELTLRGPEVGEVGKGIADLLGKDKEAEDRPPLHWTLMLEYFLAERDRAGGKIPKAAMAYQRIMDTVSHTRTGPDGDDHFDGEFDLRNIDYVSEIAKKRAASLK
ncbi:MAG: hypothetical protein ACYTHM_01720 [Planctomycetota bacterium]|jgi:hypothetical protein